VVEQFIQRSFDENVTKIIVITGKGLRSKNVENPYLSRDLSILKYSVPEFIENNKNLTRVIIETTDAKIEDGGSGAFYIYLKNKNKFK
jgi:DNA-nicking Smr family endonuclease